VGFALGLVDGSWPIGSNFASEHFHGFLHSDSAKVQLLDLSEYLFQFLRGFGESCAICFSIVYVVVHDLPHTHSLMQPAPERDCTMVVSRYNCPAKKCSSVAATLCMRVAVTLSGDQSASSRRSSIAGFASVESRLAEVRHRPESKLIGIRH
jgi:hypothetical protein